MTIAQRIGQVSANLKSAARVNEFTTLAVIHDAVQRQLRHGGPVGQSHRGSAPTTASKEFSKRRLSIKPLKTPAV